jgi:hypothetical protein
MQCLGIVTIGQAPREDMIPELRRWLGGVGVTERGALDHIGARAIAGPDPGQALVGSLAAAAVEAASGDEGEKAGTRELA